MKQITTILFLLFSAAIIHAQISVTAGDFEAQLVIGKQTTTYRDGTTSSINLGSAGQSSWDFSSLTVSDEFVTESKTVGSSPYAADFPGAEYSSNYAGTFQGTFSNTWVYNSVGDNYVSHGTGTVANSVAGDVITKIVFDPAQIEYKLPIEYQSTWNYSGQQTISTTITVPFLGQTTTSIVQQRVRNFTVDAYGTMKMPDGKILNALRIREENTLTGDNVNTSSVLYHFLTKTGESVSITLADGVTANSGNVSISAVSWTTGDGTGVVEITVAAPSELSATVGTSSIDLNWVDNADNEDGYYIERAEGSGPFSQIIQVASNVNSYSDDNVQSGIEYHYRVQGFIGSTNSDYSNTADATIVLEINVSAPTSLSAVVGENKIDLSWSDNADNEDGYNIERAVGNGSFTKITQVVANVKTYSDADTQAGVEYKYRVQAYSGSTTSDYSNTVNAAIALTGISEVNNTVPHSYELSQNYPNPFNPTTKINFSLPSSEYVSLKVYDVSGKEVSELVNQNLSSGTYSVDFNAAELSSGIYFYKFEAGNFIKMKKLMLLK